MKLHFQERTLALLTIVVALRTGIKVAVLVPEMGVELEP